jgi:hypothetical protein
MKSLQNAELRSLSHTKNEQIQMISLSHTEIVDISNLGSIKFLIKDHTIACLK